MSLKRSYDNTDRTLTSPPSNERVSWLFANDNIPPISGERLIHLKSSLDHPASTQPSSTASTDSIQLSLNIKHKHDIDSVLTESWKERQHLIRNDSTTPVKYRDVSTSLALQAITVAEQLGQQSTLPPALLSISEGGDLIAYEEREYDLSDGPMHTSDIPIEPFNMREEREQGYMDEQGNCSMPNLKKMQLRIGGRGKYDGNDEAEDDDDDDEPDAWVDSLTNPNTIRNLEIMKQSLPQKQDKSNKNDDDSDDMFDSNPLSDVPVTDEVYMERLINHLQDGETVLSAIRRLGSSQTKGSKALMTKSKKNSEKSSFTTANDPMSIASSSDSDTSTAAVNKASFSQVTECADTLLQRGFFDIYQETKESLTSLLANKRSRYAYSHSKTNNNSNKFSNEIEKEDEMYEYHLNGSDNVEISTQSPMIYGPFLFKQMRIWKQQNFFSGENETLMAVRKVQDGGPFRPVSHFNF